MDSSAHPSPSLPAGAVSASPHTMTRRTIARRLTEAKQAVPHFYLTLSCNLGELLRLRARLNEGTTTKVSVNDLVVRAVALALREVPAANVWWGDDAVYQCETADVAVAVATPRGLVTPIVRQADTKSASAISTELKELVERARRGRLKPEEYNGGNISVSNLGMYGISSFSAILNPPQACILAIGAGEQEAVVRDGAIVAEMRMNVTASVDHRSVDGAVAAQLLAAFKRHVEQPQAL